MSGEPKNASKMRGYFGSGEGWQKSNLYICTFFLEFKISSDFLQNHLFDYILSYGPKICITIRMHESLDCNISKPSWGMKWDFCM